MAGWWFLLLYGCLWGRGCVGQPSPLDYGERVPGTCPGDPLTSFDCRGSCVDFAQVRNCVAECGNGDDEECGLGQLLCDDGLPAATASSQDALCGQCVPEAAAASLCLDRRFQGLCNETGTIRCPDTRNCIVAAWLNDGADDCGDGWDEDACRNQRKQCSAGAKCSFDAASQTATCVCPAGEPSCELDPWAGRVPGQCRPNPLEWDCGDGQCLPFTKVLDCNPDCVDGSDETCQKGTFMCSDGCTCRTKEKTSTCPVEGQSQRSVCREAGALKCAASTELCVPAAWGLDGENDCGDWSDEDACLHPQLQRRPCSPDALCTPFPETANFSCVCPQGFLGDGFTCTSTAVGGRTTTLAQTPLPTSAAALTPATTASGLPEPNINDTDSLFCKPWANPIQFNCGGGVCIDAIKWLDCVKDCASGIDEVCQPGKFQCDDCKCVDPDQRFTACVEYRRCASGEFKCGTGACIGAELVLDGTWDCVDGSDESCTRLGCPATNPCAFDPQISNFTCGCPALTERDGRGICRARAGLAKDCADVLLATRDRGASAVQTVYRPGCLSPDACRFQVLCDQLTDGGGWTVVQQRQGPYNFWRDFEEYAKGFGSFEEGNFWLGNEYLFELTNQSGTDYELLIVLITMSSQRVVERYERFSLSSKEDFYALGLGRIQTSQYDNLAVNRGQPFGTNDKDKFSVRGGKVCGVVWKSGWWFDSSCSGDSGNLNVPYEPDQDQGYLKGIIWKGVPGNARIRSTSIQIRPRNFALPTLAPPPSTTPPEKTGDIVRQATASRLHRPPLLPLTLLFASTWLLR